MNNCSEYLARGFLSHQVPVPKGGQGVSGTSECDDEGVFVVRVTAAGDWWGDGGEHLRDVLDGPVGIDVGQQELVPRAEAAARLDLAADVVRGYGELGEWPEL